MALRARLPGRGPGAEGAPIGRGPGRIKKSRQGNPAALSVPVVWAWQKEIAKTSPLVVHHSIVDVGLNVIATQMGLAGVGKCF